MDLTTLNLDELLALAEEKHTRFNEIKAMETPSRGEVAEAKTLASEYTEIQAAITERQAEETASEDEMSELAELSLDQPEGEPEGDEDEAAEEGDEPEGDEPADEADEPAEEPAEEPVQAAAKPAAKKAAKKVAAAGETKTRVKASARLAGARPETPAPSGKDLVTITAAADTQYATGSEITLDDVGQASIHRLKGLPEPNGDGETEDLRYFPVANVALEFPEDLTITRAMSEEKINEVLTHAGDETRLDEPITAANGWCAPSETLYDLCGGEVVDGILDVPEVQVNRGGFKHTTGIDFSTIYAGVGFLQTEAQAIAGTTKACYEVPCPTFTDERLDAIGLCIKVPILLEAGYPEVVNRIMSGSMIAHQYKVNASVITRILASAGAARNFTSDLGSVTVDTLSGVDLVCEQLRQKYRLGRNATLEVVFPVFARSLFRNDLGNRNGRPPEAVSDAEITAHFAARHVNVQFIYGWQELTTTDLVWPASVNFLAYPAGTFVKGVSNVINLSAVYDAASLATNIYTGLFMEQGLLVARMCYEAVQATVPVNIAGRTGAPNLT